MYHEEDSEDEVLDTRKCIYNGIEPNIGILNRVKTAREVGHYENVRMSRVMVVGWIDMVWLMKSSVLFVIHGGYCIDHTYIHIATFVDNSVVFSQRIRSN